jgi:hypothetical protein
MGGSNNERLQVVRALLETAPDTAVRDLAKALLADRSPALEPVRALVRGEMTDRTVRNAVLAPIAPLCSPRPDGFKQMLFPSGALAKLWRALRALEPRTVTVAVSSLSDEDTPPAYDELCSAGAAAIREGAPAMQGLIGELEEFHKGAAAQFAGCLALAPLTRAAIRRLPGWLENMTEEEHAGVRLLFKDASAIAEDAAPRMLEILLAHTAEPWRMLTLISAATNRGGDDFLSGSELSEFCERVLADIERQVNMLRLFELDGGLQAGRMAAGALASALSEMIEFEACIDLNKEGPWSQRLGKLRTLLTTQTESWLKKTPKIVSDALPMKPVRIGGRTLRMEPNLDHLPEVGRRQRAMAILSFFDSCRSTADKGGYGSLRKKIGEEIVQGLDGHVEEIIAMVRSGDVAEPANARAFLDMIADMMALAQDENSAQIVRRRAAAAA